MSCGYRMMCVWLRNLKPKYHGENNKSGDSFNKCLVRELQSLILKEVSDSCYGCQVDHPSQTQHDMCLLTDSDDQTDIFLISAIRKLDPYQIMEEWYPMLHTMVLDDQEKLEAVRLWEHFKNKIRFRPAGSWLEQLKIQVKQAWE